MKRKLIIPLMLGCLVWFSACDSESTSTGTAKMHVRMTDAPGDYAEVNVDVQSVQVHKEGDGDESE